MKALRLVLMVLLTVSLDLAMPVVPTAGGLQWDDDEEIVHLRRQRQSIPDAAVQTRAPQNIEREPSPRPRLPRVSVHTAALEWRPLVCPADGALFDSASPPEPH